MCSKFIQGKESTTFWAGNFNDMYITVKNASLMKPHISGKRWFNDYYLKHLCFLRCPNDDTFQFFSTSDPMIQRFGVEAFAFVGFKTPVREILISSKIVIITKSCQKLDAW